MSTAHYFYIYQLLTVILDPGLMQYPCGPAIVAKLQSGPEDATVKYEILPQCRPNLVTFWRQVTEVKETENNGVSDSY